MGIGQNFNLFLANVKITPKYSAVPISTYADNSIVANSWEVYDKQTNETLISDLNITIATRMVEQYNKDYYNYIKQIFYYLET